MRYINVTIAVAIFGLMSGCASITTPSTSLRNEIPVIKIGSAGEAAKEYILYIPANTEFPVDVAINGSAFDKEGSVNTLVSLNEDLYLYQYWASRDGRNWVNAHDMFKLDVSAGLTISGGKAELKLDYME